MRRLGCFLLCAAVMFAVFHAAQRSAMAIPPFKNEFEAVYVKENPATPQETALAEAAMATTGKCWVCHVNMSNRGEKGLGKKIRNNYGKALSQLLKKEDFGSERRAEEPDKVKAEIQEAMKKVEAMKSDPDNADSPTFGELMAAGKLPGNDEPDPEDLKRAIKERDEG
jgi:hypothetical protein